MVLTARKTNSIDVKDNPKNMILIGEKKKQYFYWKDFTFLASLLHFILFTLCGKYSETICVTDSIIAIWTRSLFAAQTVSEPHVSEKCEYGRIRILAELMNTKSILLDGAHLIAMRGLIHKEVPIRVHQRGELN